MLGAHEINMLWEANPGSNDEDLRKAIFEAVQKISLELPKSLQSTLFKKVASTPADQLDTVTIDLIRQFTVATHRPVNTAAPADAPAEEGGEASVASADPAGGVAEGGAAEIPVDEVDEVTKTAGLNLLFDVSLLSPAGLPDQTVPEVARAALVALLVESQGCEAGGKLRERAVEYMVRAVGKIKAGVTVGESVQLAQAVL